MISVRSMAWVAVVAAMVLVAGVALADTHAPWPTDWNNWSDPALWVTVGNPGNAADNNGHGPVAYTFNMGKFEVTAGQYTAFLNAVAKTDTYELYSTPMDTAIDPNGCNITRSSSTGNYTYSVASDYANRPVNYVSWGDAARFANWLTNGQPTGAQGLTTTENGSYLLNGAMSVEALLQITRIAEGDRTPGKKYYFIPREEEWYKAAYHDKTAGLAATYFDYPTSSDTAPGRDMADPLPGNNANYYTDSGAYPIDSGKYTTVVGEFENSDSPYGTFDQCGNVWDWEETVISCPFFGLRGGMFASGDGELHAEFRDASMYPTTGNPYVGFRVSEVPEPATMSLLALGGLLALRRRR